MFSRFVISTTVVDIAGKVVGKSSNVVVSEVIIGVSVVDDDCTACEVVDTVGGVITSIVVASNVVISAVAFATVFVVVTVFVVFIVVVDVVDAADEVVGVGREVSRASDSESSRSASSRSEMVALAILS